MDVCGVSAPDCFRIDDLLDLSNDELFSASASASASATDSDHYHPHHLSPDNNYASGAHFSSSAPCPDQSTDFTDRLCVPSDDVAELEWLSNFVDDSFTYFPTDEFTGIVNRTSGTSSHGRSRSKRSKAASKNNGWTSSTESDATIIQKSKANANATIAKKRESSWSSSGLTGDSGSPSETSQAVPRRCTHCSSEETPQWRTGPLGPKTLCNACGVRYKSGRLVPEYRPAASPTFVLTQHSNSHRKVMELRRQKEILRQQQQQHQHQQQEQQREMFHHHHNFEVC